MSFWVQTARRQRPGRVSFEFDVSFSFDTTLRGVATNPGYPGYGSEAKTMCSVRSWVDVGEFEVRRSSGRWYSIRTVHEAKISLWMFVMDVDKAGPQFEVEVMGKRARSVAKEAEVVWYREPPHIVWGRGYIPAGGYRNPP